MKCESGCVIGKVGESPVRQQLEQFVSPHVFSRNRSVSEIVLHHWRLWARCFVEGAGRKGMKEKLNLLTCTG